MSYSGDYYAFDLNIPETKFDEHAFFDAPVTWIINENMQMKCLLKI